MRRTPEPEELMDDPAQARAYAEADFSEANNLFIELFSRLWPAGREGRMLDLGCGPADIPIALADAYRKIEIEAVDGAEAMLVLARAAVAAEAAVSDRITLHQRRLPTTDLPAGHYDALLSNSLLHHLQDPQDLWLTLAHCARPGARVLVMDLKRPDSELAADILVETHALDAPEVLRRDFHNSLLAAYTPDEVRGQLHQAGLDGLEVLEVSDRHLAVMGRL